MPFELFPYQAEDITYFESTPNVLFAYQMGTGKTVVGCERDKRIRKWASAPERIGITRVAPWRTLVICPKSVFSVWEDHLAKHCPELEVVTWNTNKKVETKEKMVTAHVLIINYESVNRNLEFLSKVEWLHIICDEVHRIKSRKAQQTQATKKLKTTYKTGLTGTPITNKPEDLWSILNWLDRKEYRAFWKFYKRYVEYELTAEGYFITIGTRNEVELQNRIKPIYVTRKKQDILKDLPDKYYTEIKVSLGTQQRRAYNEMRKEMVAWVGKQEDEAVVAPVTVAKMTRLEQFAAAYARVEENKVYLSDPSAKLDTLMDLIEDSNGNQIVVFSKFKQLIYLLHQRLDGAKIPWTGITGDTPQPLRRSVVQDFREGTAKIFCGTIGAMGTGIDGLQCASTVVFLDRSWSPSENEQAEDRLHRIGQKNALQVIDIIARDTVDRRKGESLQLKWQWIRQMLGD